MLSVGFYLHFILSTFNLILVQHRKGGVSEMVGSAHLITNLNQSKS